MIDVLKTFRTVMLARSAITDQVGSRIYAGPLKPSQTLDWATPDDVQPTIVVVPGANDEVDVESSRFNANPDILCLAGSDAEAVALAGVIFDDLNGVTGIETGTGEVVITINFTEGPRLDEDPQTRWRFARLPVEAIIVE